MLRIGLSRAARAHICREHYAKLPVNSSFKSHAPRRVNDDVIRTRCIAVQGNIVSGELIAGAFQQKIRSPVYTRAKALSDRYQINVFAKIRRPERIKTRKVRKKIESRVGWGLCINVNIDVQSHGRNYRWYRGTCEFQGISISLCRSVADGRSPNLD